ncbi:aldo/keto reductase [Phenylobacterium sp.]|uniref:aldo/keto reductase n=1 Tax=Phenylobacterium sp. TaxID=1871053 RepID=UPI002F3F7A00
MRYRRLGASDLMVSEITLGTWLAYGEGSVRTKHIACVRRALDLGINLIDTANVYGWGEAEKLIADALEGVPRDRYLIATKLWGPMNDMDRGLSRAQVFKQIDDSLRRLKTDYVDLYQCHRYDEETPLAETMQALSEIVRQGKVRWLGFSEWPQDKVREAAALAGVERFVSSQPQYSLLWREPEDAVFPLSAELGLGQLVWAPLAQGVLAGRYPPGSPFPEGWRGESPAMSLHLRRWFSPVVLEAVGKLPAIAAEASLSPAQFAIAWTLRRPEVTSAIIGASRPGQVEDNAAASGVAVDSALFAQAERLMADALAEAARLEGTGV